MLITTLNYNQPELTDNLVDQLRRDPSFSDHELMVVDNGSTKDAPKSTTHKLDHNLFFGGGLNRILEYFLSTDHEHFIVFNNDLIFHGPNLITNMLEEVREHDLDVYSPSITNSCVGQCFWKQMWNWGTKTVREVKFIDNMAPLFSRRIAEAIQSFPPELNLGWGQDFYTGLVAEDHGLRIGVSDNLNLTHLVSQTFKSGAIDISESDFSLQADHNMHQYFSTTIFNERFLNLRQYGEHYRAPLHLVH